jgi:hypothetical protein
MKVLKIKALLIFLGILAVFMVAISIYRGVQSVGWTPPDTSLKLDVNEKKWKAAFQKKNGCRITYFGLDGAFLEDSIIYLELDVKSNVDFVEKIATDGASVTEELCRQFFASSDTKRSQQYVEVTYHNMKTAEAKYPVTLRFLYVRKTGLVQKIEDRKY